jgi:hypothetical protein
MYIIYSSAPVSTGNTFQDLPQLRETADNKLNSVALVRERTIPTERPLPVGEVSAIPNVLYRTRYSCSLYKYGKVSLINYAQ